MRPQLAFNTQHQRFMQPDVVPQVVFIGDSRLNWGVHNGAMDTNLFNYAHFGEAPYGQVLRARHVIRDKPTVRAFIMQMDPYVVAGQRTFYPLPVSRGFYESLIFSTVADVESVVAPSRQELLREIAAYVFPMWIWWERVEFWGAVRHALTQVGIDGAPPPPHYFNMCADLVNRPALQWQARDERDRKAVADEAAAIRYRNRPFDPNLGRMVRDFLDYAGTRGVKVIGLRMPETLEFREASQGMMKPDAERFAYTLGIPILDYSATYVDRPEMFFDADHLTDAGAEIFSRRVAADVRQILGIEPGLPWTCSPNPLAHAGIALPSIRLN